MTERFGDYLLLDTLGAGGMGRVYRARHAESGQEVALKLPTSSNLLNSSRLARFEREGRLTATLCHPHVLTVHAAGVVDGRPFLAYQLVEGAQTLEEYFQFGDLRERVTAVRDAALGLAYAHQQGVLHRDVKPDNVLVDRTGRVLVADFGLATAEGEDRLTRTGAMLGTPLYMAPENVLEGGEAITAQADVYALGVLLYEALTRQHPYRDQGMSALVAPESRVITPPRRLAKVPKPLNRLCLAALQVDPSRRPTSAAFAQALTDWLHGPVHSALPRTLAGLALLGLVAGGAALAAALRVEAPQPAAAGPSPSSPTPAPSTSSTTPSPPVDPAVRNAALRRALDLARAAPVSFDDLQAALAELATDTPPRHDPGLAADLADAVFHLQTHSGVADDEKVPLLEAFAATRCEPRDHDQPGLIDGYQTLLVLLRPEPPIGARAMAALFRLDLRVTKPLLNAAIDLDYAEARLRRDDLDPYERYAHLRALFKSKLGPDYRQPLLEASRAPTLGPRARAQGLTRVHVNHAFSQLDPQAMADLELAYQLDPESPRVAVGWAVALLQTPGRLDEGHRQALRAWEAWRVRRQRPTLRYQDADFLRFITNALLDAGRDDWAEAFVDRAQGEIGDARLQSVYEGVRRWIAGFREGRWPEARDEQLRARKRDR